MQSLTLVNVDQAVFREGAISIREDGERRKTGDIKKTPATETFFRHPRFHSK
jgi:hypothetical protein